MAKNNGTLHFSVDVETDGKIQGFHSMISFGVVLVDKNLDKNFYAEIKPITENYDKERLKISGYTREEVLCFKDAKEVMENFESWLKKINPENKRLIFWSDNNGFDFAWINWYCFTFLGYNPFGHSSYNLGSFYKGLIKNCYKNFKFLRKTKHTHNALDDAKGNAEAMLEIQKLYKINGFNF